MSSTAPEHLGEESKKLWKASSDKHKFEEHQLCLLTLACDAFDRCKQAREYLENRGLSEDDRYNIIRQRPEVDIERKSRLEFVNLLMKLGLSFTGS